LKEENIKLKAEVEESNKLLNMAKKLDNNEDIVVEFSHLLTDENT
jgi:hypothetical protein